MKVLALMSGGVDSSVAAFLLKRQGHEVTGLTLKLFEISDKGPGCCGSPRDIYDAKDCARVIGIPHYTLDETVEFREKVIEPFRGSYLGGETPNPCVECNRSMKFGRILELAKAWSFEAVATGHYARVAISDQRSAVNEKLGTPRLRKYELLKAKDSKKDQSYFLYMLNQEQLARIVFPLGDMEKAQVRSAGREAGLSTADKNESQDICFVGALGGDYRKLLEGNDASGPIIESRSGRELGRHRGYFHYTVGQREGLGISRGKPWYVTSVNPQTNAVFVGDDEDLNRSSIDIREVCWVDPDLGSPDKVEIKIRYKSPAFPALLETQKGGYIRAIFDSPQRAPSPGQFAVFYAGERLLGGGKIK